MTDYKLLKCNHLTHFLLPFIVAKAFISWVLIFFGYLFALAFGGTFSGYFFGLSFRVIFLSYLFELSLTR